MARKRRPPPPATVARGGVPPPPPSSKGGGRKPARKPTQTDKIAVVNWAENRILPSEVPVPKPPKAKGAPYLPPQPTTWAITPPSPPPRASLNTRYKWALGSVVDPSDRLKLAVSMSDRKKTQKLRAAAVSRKAALDAAVEAAKPRPNRFDVLGRLGIPTPYDFGKKAVDIERAGGHVLTDLQSGRAATGAAKSLGVILPAVGRGAAGVIQGLAPGRLSSGPGGPMVTGYTPAERQQMGIVSPGQLQTAAIGVGKVAVGLPVSIAGIIAKPEKTVNDLVGMLRGAGLFESAGAVSIPDMIRQFFDPGIKQSDREKSFRTVLEGTKKYLDDNYGGDVTWREALVDKPWNEPLMHFVDSVTAVAPLTKLAVAVRYWKAGYTWTDAQRLARDPVLLTTPEALERQPAKPLIYKPRTLTVQQKEGLPFTVEAYPSRSPTGRAAGRVYDVGSKALEAVGGGKVPILRGVTQTGRGLRITNRGLRRANRRLHAQAAALWKDVSDYVGGDEGRGARLFFNAQKPAGVDDEVWLKSIGEDAQQLLDEGMKAKGVREPTPLERRLQRQLDAFRAQALAASSDRWLTRVKDVHHEIERLNASRLAIEADLKEHRRHLAELEASTGGMTTRARTAEEAQVHLDELLLEHQMQVEEMARAKFGPIDKREVAQRNVARGKAKRANARANKSLKARGFKPAELRLDRTVKGERHAAIERDVENFIADNPDHPIAQRWQARSDEIDRLRRGLTPEPEELFPLPVQAQADLERVLWEADQARRAAINEQGIHADIWNGPSASAEATPEVAAAREAEREEARRAGLALQPKVDAAQAAYDQARRAVEQAGGKVELALGEVKVTWPKAPTRDESLLGTVETPRAPMTPEEARALGEEIRFTRDSIRRQETLRKQTVEQASDLAPLNATAPVEAAMRTALEQRIRSLPKVTPEEADGLMRLFDARAREWGYQNGRDPGEWFTDPNGFGLAEVRMIENHADLPKGALAQLGFDLERAVTPEVKARNLRYVEGGDLYKPQLGLQRNGKVYRRVNGKRVLIIGAITPEEWVQRVLAVVPSAAERDKLARWYRDVSTTFQKFFGDNPDAEALVRGFAVSQANASPASGLQAVLRVMDRIKTGQEIGGKEISTVVKSIEAALRDEHVTRGLAAKLHDFIDSIEGKHTRTWMGDDPRGGWPTANDIHAIRDLGYVDKKIVARLRNPERGAPWKRGIQEFEVDSGGSPTVHQYERMRKQYEAISQHLNDISFDGRGDWTPSEVQALGWSTVQRLHGAIPEDLTYAAVSNMRKVSIDISDAAKNLGADVTLGEAQRIAEQMTDPIEALIAEQDNVYLDGAVEASVSGEKAQTSAVVQFNLIGSPERIRGFLQELEGLLGPVDARARKFSGSGGGAKPTLIIKHSDLADPVKANQLYQALLSVDRKRHVRFSTLEEDGQPAIAVEMSGTAISETTHAAEAKALKRAVDRAVNETLGDVEYRWRLSNTQTIDPHWRTRGKRPLRGLEGTGSERTLADRVHAEARGQLEDALAAVRAERDPHAPTPPQLLAQVRRGDLNGAVQFLNTSDGQRILFLTRQADVSTLLHELFGHGVREIAFHYPEEFAKVEAWIGRPLAEWTAQDHERFARVSERYFASGTAPVPELVDTFASMKSWMRAVYGGMRNTSDVPAPVRVALDSYFGSYNDNNVFRVAAMTSRSAGRAPRRAGLADPEYQATRSGILADFSDKDLAKLRAQNDARAFARSKAGIEKKWERLNKNLREKHGGDVDSLTEEEQAELYRTYERLMKITYMEDLADIDRETGLRRRIVDIEKALAAPDGEAYEGALASMRALIQLREDVLRDVHGAQYDEIFSNRVDLLADYMADKGFIPADFARGTAMYVPHRGVGARARLLDRPGMPLTGNVVGETKKLSELGNRNELLRWQHGDLDADPKVVFHAWQDAQAFAFVYHLKELLWNVGRDLLPNEAIPDGAMLINKNGVPVPHLQKVATSPARTAEAQKALAALEGRDLDRMQNQLETYVNEVLKPSDEVRDWLQSLPPKDKIAAYAQHRIVDRRIVEAMFRPLRGSSTSIGGTVLDLGNTVARWALIYTNPAYVPINAIGNSFFVLGQQGPAAISGYIRAAKIALQNKNLAIRIAGEAGETPAIAGISRGRARTSTERWLREKEDRGLSALTAFPDRYPRITAWIYEARRLGYDTPAKMEKLIDGGTPTLERHRELVANRTDEIMVSFDRLSDTERAVFTRWLFIWPWIRGATAWPFYYAKEYPFATGVAATVGQQTEQYRKQTLGDLPIAYRDMFPLWGANGYESVINTAPISVGSTAAQSIEAIRDNVLSLFGEHNIAGGTALVDFMQPAWQFALEGATRRNLQTGQPMTLQDAFFQNLWGFAPQGGKIRQMIDPSLASGAYRNRTRRAILQRGGIWPPGVGRVEPTTIDVTKLQGWAQRGFTKTSQEKVQAEIDSLRKRVAASGAPPVPPYVIRGLQVRQWLQDQRDTEVTAAKKAGWHPSTPSQTEPVLTDLQEAWIAWGMYKKFFPDYLPQPPTSYPAYALADYTQQLLYGPNTPLSQVSQYMSAVADFEKAKKVRGG